MKQKLSVKQGMSRRTIIVVASSSVLLVVVALLFIFNVGNIRHTFATPTKRTVTSVKDGNWNDGSTWSTGSAPTNYSSDSIVILHNVNYNVDFTVGNQTRTGIYIGPAGNLNNNGHSLTLEKYASLVNAGTLNIKGISFNGNGFTDPSFSFTNSGTISLNNGFNLTNHNATITNSGTMTIPGASKIDGTLNNSGTITITGNFDFDYATITNSGHITFSGSSTFTGTSLTNTTYGSTFYAGTSITLNYGSTTNSISRIVNSGTVKVGNVSQSSLTMNDGSITNGSTYNSTNGPIVNVNGSVTINSGGHSDTNKILNNGLFAISTSVTAYPVSSITNNDSLTIGTDFSSQAGVFIGKLSYMSVGGTYTNNSGTYAGLTNNGGYILAKNFTNNWNASFTGTGGGMAITNTFINHSTITGTTDVCDKTPNTSSDVNGTMNTGVTTCSYIAPTTGPSALPVVLTSFTAKRDGNAVALNWITASEINNDRFEIERSEDGKEFSVIGTVKGNGTKSTRSTYSYDDENPLSGIGYYRLHQIDFNGKSDYSSIAVVHASGVQESPLELNVYPNPVHAGSALHLDMTVPVSEQMTVDIINMGGASIYHDQTEVGSGKQDKEVQLPSGLKTGIYIINITYRGQVTTKKIQVQ